ncbi:MAG TPA: (deoxy)nucleoside triphosphate pyrophosphohydrolase [Vicinamibacterales bacterium]|nr:(deoxy)nucleoside triphosphate pyrophosphohydrolase [Vicinamibacterales bacterium]
MAVIVAAAVIERGGAVLVTRRPKGAHLEGLWEFPGGKCEPGESIHECLIREIVEELGVRITPRQTMLVTSHAYPDKTVKLHFIACDMEGEPSPQQGQEMQWIERARLDSLEFPEADATLIAQLRRT